MNQESPNSDAAAKGGAGDGTELDVQSALDKDHATRSNRTNKWVLAAVNCVLLIIFAIWLEKNIDAAGLGNYLSRISILAVLVSLAINLGSLAAYGLRMSLILGKNFGTGFVTINSGYALNTILPLRLGEPAKILFVHRRYSIPLAQIGAATVAEKLVDLSKVAVLGLIVVTFTVGQGVDAHVLIRIGAFLILSIMALLVLRMLAPRLEAVLSKAGMIGRLILDICQHSSRYPIGAIAAITVVIWILNIALVYYAFNNYLPNLQFSLLDAVTMLVILALAIATPSAPAGIGLFEAAVIAYLTQTHSVQNEAALAVAVIFHLVITVPQLAIFGAVLLASYLRSPTNTVRH